MNTIDIIDQMKFDLYMGMTLAFCLGLVVGVLSVTSPFKFNFTSKCNHKQTILRTMYSSINCETTAVFCKDCYKQLTEAKTDCR